MANEFIIKNGFISKGNSSIEGTFSLNTISATTYQNLPTDVRVTGGTYSSGTATFTNNTGGTFSVTGFSTSSSLTVGTTPITSGTVGGILFEGTGNVVQEDSNLFWDNTNKRLGVGITPSYPLDVKSTTGSYSLNLQANSDTFRPGIRIEALRSTNSGIAFNLFDLYIGQSPTITNVGGFGLYGEVVSSPSPSYAKYLYMGANSTTAFNNAVFKVDSDDKIGIGLSGADRPTARLDVRAQGTLSTDIAFRVRNSADTNNIISISSNGQFTLGLGAVTSGFQAVSIGNVSSSLGLTSVTIGAGSSASLASESSLAVGFAANVTGNRGISLGLLTSTTGDAGIALGERATVSGVKGISIGSAATVTASNSVMIGGGGVTNAIVYSNAFTNGLNGYSFFNDINSNHVVNSAIIPVNNVSYLNTTKNVIYLGTAVKPTSTIKNGVQIYTNYRTISAATSTVGSTATGIANGKTLTFTSGTSMSNLTVGTRIIVTNDIGEQTHANIVSVVGLVVTIDSAMVNINVSTLNANATTVTNSSIVIISDFHQETRNDKGDIIKLYKETTGVTASTLVSNGGTTITNTDTFDGYTIQQVVKALRNLGVLE